MNNPALPSPGHEAPVASNRSSTVRVRGASVGSFVICLAAALGLNLIAISAVAAITLRWQGLVSGKAQTSWITATTIERAADKTAASAAVPVAAGQSRPIEQPRPPRPESLIASQQALPALPLDEADAGEPPVFYGFGEVDRPAEPVPDSDWNLDPAALDAFGVQSVVFDIFISQSGEVVGCSIIEPRSLPDDTRVALENRLKLNVLQPAIRHHTAVASVRRIEISVVEQGS